MSDLLEKVKGQENQEPVVNGSVAEKSKAEKAKPEQKFNKRVARSTKRSKRPGGAGWRKGDTRNFVGPANAPRKPIRHERFGDPDNPADSRLIAKDGSTVPMPAVRVRVDLFPGIEKTIAAIKECAGSKSGVARWAGVTRATVYQWIRAWPEIEEAFIDARSSSIDELEGLLMDQARKGNIAAIIFGLKTLGKDRGYTESTRMELAGELAVDRRKNPKEDAAYLEEVMVAMKELRDQNAEIEDDSTFLIEDKTPNSS